MDYETVAECIYEIKTHGIHEEDAFVLLANEIKASSPLTAIEQGILLSAIYVIDCGGHIGRLAALEELFDVLLKDEGFCVEWARITAEVLLGER